MTSNTQEAKLAKTNSFECPDISKKISKNLQALHETREFSDLILIGSDGIQIRTHRIILCCSTQYFNETFHKMPKTNKQTMQIEVKEFESSTLESVLQFIYIGSVDFLLETVRKVLRAADHFKMQPLMDLCFEFMEQELKSNNCLNTALFAKEHCYEEFYKECFSFACNNFEEICFGIEFLNLDGKMVDEILSSDEVVVSSEEKIVRCLLMWLEHDRKNREEAWRERLSNVHYQFLAHSFILENTSALCTNLECHKLIRQWLEWHVLPEKRQGEYAVARNGYKSTKNVLFTGFYSSELWVQTYYPEFNTWTIVKVQSSRDTLYYFSPLVYKTLVIIAGGVKKDRKLTNEVTFVDIETDEEELLPSMNRSRASSGSAILNDYLYIIGGNGVEDDKRINLLSVERFNLLDRKWEDVAPLLSPVNRPKTAVLNDCLYVVSNNRTQCYSTKNNQWSYKATKRVKCTFFGLVSCGGYLFTVGGCLPSQEVSDSVERYNPLSDTWDVITSLRSPRDQLMCFAINNNSFVVAGGVFDSEWIDLVEEYNIETNEWKTLAPLIFKNLNIQMI